MCLSYNFAFCYGETMSVRNLRYFPTIDVSLRYFTFRRPSNRAQRASARNLAQSTSAGALSLPQDIDSLSTQTIQDIEPPLLGDDDAPSSNSRSASVQPIDIPILSNPSEMNGERSNGKGKGKRRADKELEKANVRVKEEPVTVHLSDIPTGPVSIHPSTSDNPRISSTPGKRGSLFGLQFRWCSSILRWMPTSISLMVFKSTYGS